MLDKNYKQVLVMILCGDDIVLLLYADQQIKRMNSGPESHLRRGKN